MLFSRNPSCCFRHSVDDHQACLPPLLLKQQVLLGRQMRGLVLSSSARVLQVIYSDSSWNFGKFVAFHADAKSSLAVLHNLNDMTNLFRASNWVS